jgi:hypothetical protein
MPKKSRGRLTAKKNKTVKASPWANHVHMCMEKYGLTYKQAASDSKCRNLYYLGREKA